jgi:uridylate kinase
VLLKLSGEALAGETKFGYDFERLSFFASRSRRSSSRARRSAS